MDYQNPQNIQVEKTSSVDGENLQDSEYRVIPADTQPVAANQDTQNLKAKSEEPPVRLCGCCSELNALYVGCFLHSTGFALLITSLCLPNWFIRTFPAYPNITESIGPLRSCLSLSLGKQEGCHSATDLPDGPFSRENIFIIFNVFLAFEVGTTAFNIIRYIIIIKNTTLRRQDRTPIKILKYLDDIIDATYLGHFCNLIAMIVTAMWWDLQYADYESERKVTDPLSKEYLESYTDTQGPGFIMFICLIPFFFIDCCFPCDVGSLFDEQLKEWEDSCPGIVEKTSLNSFKVDRDKRHTDRIWYCCSELKWLCFGLFIHTSGIVMLITSFFLPNWFIRRFPAYPDVTEAIGPFRSCLSLSLGKEEGCHSAFDLPASDDLPDYRKAFWGFLSTLVLTFACTFLDFLGYMVILKNTMRRQKRRTPIKILYDTEQVISYSYNLHVFSIWLIFTASMVWGLEIASLESERRVKDPSSKGYLATNIDTVGPGFILFICLIPLFLIGCSFPSHTGSKVKEQLKEWEEAHPGILDELKRRYGNMLCRSRREQRAAFYSRGGDRVVRSPRFMPMALT